MIAKLTDAAQEVLELARDEARRLGHGAVGSEHILMALTRWSADEGGAGTRALDRLGVTESAVRSIVERLFPQHEGALSNDPQWTPELTYVLIHTRWLAAYMHRAVAGTEHLLLGALWERGGMAGCVLGELGVTFEDVYREATGHEPPPEVTPEPLRDYRFGEPVYVPFEQLEPLLARLPGLLPPDTPHAFNHDYRRAWFWAAEGVDLEDYIRRALAEGDAPNPG